MFLLQIQSRMRSGFHPWPTFSSSSRSGLNPIRLVRPAFRQRQQSRFGLNPIRLARPAFRQRQQQQRQQPRSRTTVLQQTLVVNDHTNVPNPRQNQRSSLRSRLGPAIARSSSGGRTGSRGAPSGGSRRGPGRFSLGHGSLGRAAVRRPTIVGSNLARIPNPSSLRRVQPVLLVPGGGAVQGGGAGGGETHARGGSQRSGGNRQIGHLGLTGNSGIGLRTGASAGRGNAGLNVGAGTAGGGSGRSTGGVGGIGADLGLNPGTSAGLLAAGMGLDLVELHSALGSLLGQSNQQNNVVNSLLGQNNQQNIQPPVLPTVSSGGLNASPTGGSPTTSSVNPQTLLGQILGDNRREGALPGDANERLIERIRAVNPQLLPPDV